jgi:hypothetical protein
MNRKALIHPLARAFLILARGCVYEQELSIFKLSIGRVHQSATDSVHSDFNAQDMTHILYRRQQMSNLSALTIFAQCPYRG